MAARYSPELEDVALSAYGAGFSQRDVGYMLGIQGTTVGRMLKRHYFPSMNNPHDPTFPDPFSDFRALLASFRTVGDIEFEPVIRLDLCALCGCREKIQLDHIHPVSQGGEDHWFNWTALCNRCNSKKRTKSLLFAMLS